MVEAARTYLDANAQEPIRPAALTALTRTASVVGNPSSVHAPGRAARRVLEDAREAVAARHAVRPADLVFTGGGTEAVALAIAAYGAGRPVIIGPTEHDAVRAAAPDAAVLECDRDGVADLDHLARLLADHPGALVCLMLANNETGVLQPVAAAASLVRRHGGLLFTDAVQAAGRLATPLGTLGAHAVALSSHKVGGPPGAGALLLAADAPPLKPLIAGGGQERGRRGGTPDLPAIVGFAAAVTEAAEDGAAAHRLAGLRDAVEAASVASGAVPLGARAPRLANTTCLALPGVRADAQVIALDLAGIAVSAGAACSSGKVARSRVLDAMGAGALAGEAIRVSLPWSATADDVAAFASAYATVADRLRRAVAA
jgi:cysteine desulfurase